MFLPLHNSSFGQQYLLFLSQFSTSSSSSKHGSWWSLPLHPPLSPTQSLSFNSEFTSYREPSPTTPSQAQVKSPTVLDCPHRLLPFIMGYSNCLNNWFPTRLWWSHRHPPHPPCIPSRCPPNMCRILNEWQQEIVLNRPIANSCSKLVAFTNLIQLKV